MVQVNFFTELTPVAQGLAQVWSVGSKLTVEPKGELGSFELGMSADLELGSGSSLIA